MSFMPYVSPDQLMKDRSEYAHKGIARGRSVAGLEFADGLLFIAENPSATLHKISEIRSDRVRGRREVQRVRGPADRRHPAGGPPRLLLRSRGCEGAGPRERVLQALSTIFTQQMKPYEVEILVGEVNGEIDGTSIIVLFDGSVTDEHGFVAIGVTRTTSPRSSRSGTTPDGTWPPP